MKPTFPDKQRLLSKLHRTLRLLPHFPKPLPQPTLGAGSESLLQIGFPETSSVLRTQTETSSFRPQQFARWTDPADIWADPADALLQSLLAGREAGDATKYRKPDTYFGTNQQIFWDTSRPLPSQQLLTIFGNNLSKQQNSKSQQLLRILHVVATRNCAQTSLLL